MFPVLVAAQGANTSLRGTLSDPSGAVISGAQVSLTNAANGFSQKHTSDADGTYQFPQLAPGKYTLVVDAPGFGAQTQSVDLLINQPTTVNFSLRVKTEATTISVGGWAPVLNSTDASMGDAFDNGTIQALPVEGDIPDLLSLQPGVLYLGLHGDQSHDSRTGTSAGARSDQNNSTLDGLDNNDQVRAYAFTGVLRSTLDSVEEFRVTTGGLNADTGRSSGAQINIMTKSGTNELHGTVYGRTRSLITPANDWFNKQAELSEALPNLPGALGRSTYGASLGGPIVKNKLFFFVTYEGQKINENRQMTMIVPTPSLRAGQIKYPSTQNGVTQIVTLNSAQIASMDPNCGQNGTCPWGPGVDPNSLAVFNQYPLPNGYVAGDSLNTASYTWSAPDPASLNTYIAKLDYVISNRHRLFFRGNLQNDSSQGAPQFPGQPASSANTDDSKGLAAGLTSTLTANLMNSLRYSYVRQSYSSNGVGQGSYANFYGMSTIQAESRTTNVDVPVQSLVDDLTWTHGRHTVTVGANYRLIHNQSLSNALSYDSAVTNSYALANAGIVGTGQSFDPTVFGFPAVDSAFSGSYNFSMTNLAGLLDYVTTPANYQVSANGTTGTLLPGGAALYRDFKNNEFEWYAQDSWRARPNLTVTFGLRHTLLQTPYEVNGQQVQPTTNLYQWFETRGQQAALGNSVQPYLSFAPSGQARGLQPYWPMQKDNFAPRVAFAYSPNVRPGFWRKLLGNGGDSVLRAGYGIYYDHYGESIVSLFNQYGSFGLSESITNPTNVLTPDTSPRFTGIHDIPSLTGTPQQAISYPALSPTDPLTNGFAIAQGIDSQMQTPYSHVVNVSWQRQLPAGFVLETSYLGRFGRNLLQQVDLAQPLNLVDPASGTNYFSAATQLSKYGYAGATNVPAIPYFENMFPGAAQNGQSATQNIYNDIWRYSLGNETAALYALDILCYPGCNGQTGRYWATQYASLYSWASIGESNYNAGQVTLRHAMRHGFQMEFSYTYSKALDMGSDDERTVYSSSTGSSVGSSFSAILNAWNPRLNYGPSDYDVRHLIATSWVVELPFGKGKWLGNQASPWLDHIIGGWQLSGVGRWTSGLPFSVISGAGWGTNWLEKSNMIQTGAIATGTTILPNGAPDAFANPAQALANLENPYPGEAGQRNNFRGDGYFGIDTRLAKTWKLSERTSMQFAWDVFNVTNSVRFDVNPLTSLQNLTTSGSFGVYGAALTTPRVQQLSLRFSF
ncbi:MAG TPA: TonB-dependent receptor [Candidatus Angelobacter sp.]|nr:TonB-dependent receptor [Candidatus Angelobacter sp.]